MKKSNIILLICSFFISIIFFIGQYHIDNKYTYDSPIGYNGTIDLSGGTSSTNMLTYGWEIYQDIILNPQDIDKAIPNEIIYIGQYDSLNLNKSDKKHTQATYHLKIKLPSQKQYYAIEIPEIYSASRIYVDNELMWSSGNIEDYQPQVNTGLIMFHAENEINITIQVRDETHYYSGIVYPFLFGYQQNITHILNMRQMLRYIVCTVAFVISLLTFTLGLRNRNNRFSFYLLSLFSLCACLYLAYPLYHLWGLSFVTYHIEDICFFIMIGCIVQLHCQLCHLSSSIRKKMGMLNICFILAVIICPLFFYIETVIQIYSICIDCYKYFLIGWTLVTAIFQFESNNILEKIWLCDISVFVSALFMNAYLPLFEPVCTFYQIEIACFFILLTLSLTYIIESIQQTHEKILIQQNLMQMKQQYNILNKHYQVIQENIDITKQMRHDLRHHYLLIQNDLQKKDYYHLENYINNLLKPKSQKLHQTICLNHVFNATLSYYIEIAREKNIHFEYQVKLPSQLSISDWELSVILGNLLENAIEACQENETIQLDAYIKDNQFVLKISNPIHIKPIKFHDYLSTKHNGFGIGIKSVQNIIESLNGECLIHDTPPFFIVTIIIWQAI